jgi:hypothetical protein
MVWHEDLSLKRVSGFGLMSNAAAWDYTCCWLGQVTSTYDLVTADRPYSLHLFVLLQSTWHLERGLHDNMRHISSMSKCQV